MENILKSRELYYKNIRKIRKSLKRGWKEEFIILYYNDLSEDRKRTLMYKLMNWVRGASYISGYEENFADNLQDYMEKQKLNVTKIIAQ